jgi:SNF2 family DNA or RNA helicase
MLPQVEAASGMHRKGLVLSTITKLKQICNHPVLFLKDGSDIAGRSHKISRLEALLEEIVAEGDKVLLFTQFSQLGHLLQPYLQQKFDTEVLFLHGALPKQAREKLVNRFQQPSGPPIFLLSLKAGGFGLNLTEANQVVHLDQWWNPAVEDQATDRAYRIGQKRNVQVRKLICQGTLEERIAEMLKHKKELADQIVGSTKDSITQLSTAELRRLLELSAAPTFGDSVVGSATDDEEDLT